MKRYLFSLTAFVLSAAAYAQRESVSLDRGWSYTPGWVMSLTDAGRPVDLPHTWNTDALGARPDYYRGVGNYLKIIEIPEEWQGRRLFLRFGGANSVCNLYVNGKHAGEHRGGYTAFACEITRHVNFGGRNTLLVKVNNSPALDLLPLTGDFNIYGGLYRSVELVTTPATHIALDDYGSCGLYVTPTHVSAAQADINTLVGVRGGSGEMAVVTFVLRDGEGNTLDSLTRRVKLDSKGCADIAASFGISQPRLWSTDDPYLYDMEARVSGSGGYDTVKQSFGVRWFSVDDQNRFLLNGNPVRIQGVCRVEDWDGIGNALRPQNHRRDVELMKEMGVNAVRCAYFPNDPYFLDLCDRAGILVWSEIPLVGAGQYRDKGFSDSEGFWNDARRQLREMIHQFYNHPSVVWWGIFDQLTQRGDDPLTLVRELNKIAREEGGGRLTVAASNQDGDLNFVTDLIGFNQFMGWISGQPEDFAGWTSDLRKGFPTLKSGVSEYGAGASVYQWEDSLCRPDYAGAWHPEQWQTALHETYWSVIASKPSFWGTFVWTMFDYGAAHRTDGARPGVADYGLVTFDRSVRKDAFYFYKANWNASEPFVHIVDKRYDVRRNPSQTLRVFSNQNDVELFVNGVSQGLRVNDGLGRFVWENVALRRGANTVEAVDPMTGRRDKAVITIRPQTVLPEPSLPGGAGRSTPSSRLRPANKQ
ncbi:glycoside hydrolase family 2 TIM barrel-domain containing protein [uncultured Rikenella sp.]|uniref:glycoside hydrolase family 2 protein n=1 Tax=uncultured Rikenella sp. TaxID=368003 RepID=UPI0026052F69|nr:glycoside hydrolase family 2 TIM barrel-domain containing protein [uncultured Rikenella sp.]